MDSSEVRVAEVRAFASDHLKVQQILPITADASVRNYWRIETAAGHYIVMHSPSDLVDIGPFVTIGAWLYSVGIPVPKVIAQDDTRCYLLIEDLGDASLFAALESKPEIVTLQKPIEALVAMSRLEKPDFLPSFNQEILLQELQLFDEWCLAKGPQATQPGDCDELYKVLVASAMDQPQGFVHRDYHSMNIHFCPDKAFGLGIIDFQDAVWGPSSYDLISLLLDRYITWPQHELDEIIEVFRVQTGRQDSSSEFKRQVLWVGLQRNIRILGVFQRLSLRDSKDIYLNYVPRKAFYCQRVIEMYDELKPISGGFVETMKSSGWSS